MTSHHQPPEPSHLDLALAEIANRASRLAHRVRDHEVGTPELVAELIEIVTVAEGMIGGEGITALEIAPADFS